ncbi:MAG: IclR family transcriptional regulator [Oscillospiraceae bacterium]|nr:IclR family transcriptional regulator [Oscillospiraceae bacterium]
MIQSVERAVQILRCFEKKELLGVTEIAEMTKLNKSTAFGLIVSLAELGMLERDDACNRYRLGLELYRLGSLVNMDLRRLVMPELTELVEKLEETVNFVMPDGGSVVYLVKKESVQSMRICTKTGQRLPMYCSAVGKAILAFLPQDEQNRIIEGFQYVPYTNKTIVTEQGLRDDLAKVRQTGYALDREELEYGLICIAVPIYNGTGQAAASISCSGPMVRMTEEKISICREALAVHADRITKLMR